MPSFSETLVAKHVKLCSIDEAKVLKKRATLQDSLALTTSLQKELETQYSEAKLLEAVGVVVILTSLVSDIIMDTYGATLGKSNNPFLVGLGKLNGEARKHKWKGNLYEKEMEKISKAGTVLDCLAKGDKTGMIGAAVSIHKNMLINMTGLLGHTEGSRQSKMALINALKSLRKNIDALEQESRRNQFYLDHGEGAAPEQRFTPRTSVPPLS